MSRWDYGKGLPSVINGTAESEEQLQQQAREVVARKLGIDPQERVHKDMEKNFAAYPKNWGLNHCDKNIDHRR